MNGPSMKEDHGGDQGRGLALQIPPELITAIGEHVIERLMPLMASRGKTEEDVIFDVPGLSGYLKVDESWVYDAVKLQKIPFYKVGKYLRFRKRAVDTWLEKQSIGPLPPMGRKRGK